MSSYSPRRGDHSVPVMARAGYSVVVQALLTLPSGDAVPPCRWCKLRGPRCPPRSSHGAVLTRANITPLRSALKASPGSPRAEHPAGSPSKEPNADGLSMFDAHCLSSAFRGLQIASNGTRSYTHAGSTPKQIKKQKL